MGGKETPLEGLAQGLKAIMCVKGYRADVEGKQPRNDSCSYFFIITNKLLIIYH